MKLYWIKVLCSIRPQGPDTQKHKKNEEEGLKRYSYKPRNTKKAEQEARHLSRTFWKNHTSQWLILSVTLQNCKESKHS